MKKLLIIFLLLFNSFSVAQSSVIHSDTALSYYPLNIGDKWIYNETIITTIPPVEIITRLWKSEVIKDTLMSNNRWYYETRRSIFPREYSSSNLYYVRIDTSELKIYEYDPWSDTTNFENLILDLTMKVGDTLFTPFWTIVFENAGYKNYFNNQYNYREYSHSSGFLGYGDHYLKNIGMYKFTWAADFVYSISDLKGCYISGVVYGDTTVVSVNNESKPIVNEFNLGQNYPNPFNPNTVIGFQLPVSGNVVLKIFDVIGNEVAVLVDEYKPAGEYEVEFNASALPSRSGSALTSGVYFYQLKVTDPETSYPNGQAEQGFVETKKMILLR
jgi:hypothetical protein